MPQTNYTIIRNKCIIDKIFKVYLESRIKKMYVLKIISIH